MLCIHFLWLVMIFKHFHFQCWMLEANGSRGSLNKTTVDLAPVLPCLVASAFQQPYSYILYFLCVFSSSAFFLCMSSICNFTCSQLQAISVPFSSFTSGIRCSLPDKSFFYSPITRQSMIYNKYPRIFFGFHKVNYPTFTGNKTK